MQPLNWQSEDGVGSAISRLIQFGAIRVCPRCRYVPANRDESIFEPLSVDRRAVSGCSSVDESHVTVLTLACTQCGYLIEHCLDYLDQVNVTSWEDCLYLGLGADPEYDILAEVADFCRQTF